MQTADGEFIRAEIEHRVLLTARRIIQSRIFAEVRPDRRDELPEPVTGFESQRPAGKEAAEVPGDLLLLIVDAGGLHQPYGQLRHLIEGRHLPYVVVPFLVK